MSARTIDRLLRPLRDAARRGVDALEGRNPRAERRGGEPRESGRDPDRRPLDDSAGARLHLGCGADYWPGWVNIDAAETARCDLRLDFSRLGESFADGSVAEVAMIHSLSYLRLWEARQLFADLHRLLRPGGRLVLELPDLAKCAERALRSQRRRLRGAWAEGDEEEYLEAVRGLYAFDMEQIERREAFTPYAFGWSAWHLRRELARAGFVDIRVLDPVTHGPRPWRDSRIEATA